MKLKNILLIGALVGGFFTGCSNQPQPQKSKNVEVSVPWEDFCNSYVQKFRQKGGVAACSCDESDTLSNIDFAKDIADSEARNKLASILEVKVRSLMTGHRNRVKNGSEMAIRSDFEKVFKEVVDKNLKGSYPIAHKIFRTEENKYKVCSVVALDGNAVKKIINESVSKTKLPESEKLLYEEFKAKQAQEQLDKELKKNQ